MFQFLKSGGSVLLVFYFLREAETVCKRNREKERQKEEITQAWRGSGM